MPVYHPVSAAEHNTFGIKPIPGHFLPDTTGRQCPILVCMIPLIRLFLINPASHHRAALGEIAVLCRFSGVPAAYSCFSPDNTSDHSISAQDAFKKLPSVRRYCQSLAVSDPLALHTDTFLYFQNQPRHFLPPMPLSPLYHWHYFRLPNL